MQIPPSISTMTSFVDEGGNSVSAKADSNGSQNIRITGPTSAYGSVNVDEGTPLWNIDCTYGAPSGFYMEYSSGATGSNTDVSLDVGVVEDR